MFGSNFARAVLELPRRVSENGAKFAATSHSAQIFRRRRQFHFINFGFHSH